MLFHHSTVSLSNDKDDVAVDPTISRLLEDDFGVSVEYHGIVLQSIRAFQGSRDKAAVSVEELQSLGKDTIATLAESVQQEQARRQERKKGTKREARPSAFVMVNIPHLGVKERTRWKLGESLLDAARNQEIFAQTDSIMEGACGGNMSCSTCHVYIRQQAFQDLLDDPSETELDMIDMAFEPTSESRLACQVRLTPHIIDNLPEEDLEFDIPKEANNLWEPDN